MVQKNQRINNQRNHSIKKISDQKKSRGSPRGSLYNLTYP